jgi:hypothetical protein
VVETAESKDKPAYNYPADGELIVGSVLRDDMEEVKRLLNEGIDINAWHLEHGSAIQAASRVGNTLSIQFLLDKGADLDTNKGFNGSALYIASSAGREDIVKLLLDKGADANVLHRDHSPFSFASDSPLSVASRNGYTGIVQLLLKKGAIADADTGSSSPLFDAASKLRDELSGVPSPRRPSWSDTTHGVSGLEETPVGEKTSDSRKLFVPLP